MVTTDSGLQANNGQDLPGKPQPDREGSQDEERGEAACKKSTRKTMMSETDEPKRRPSKEDTIPIKQPKHFYYRGRDFFSSMEVDLAVGALIFVNVLFMFAQCQYDGLDIGHKLQPNGTVYTDFPHWLSFPVPATEEWPYAKEILSNAELTFTIIFAVDVALKIVFLGAGFWTSFLNILDATVVVLGLYGLADAAFQNPSYARILRLVKVTRLAGALKNSTVVASLQMLLKCISSSVLTLGWSLAVLITMQSIMGLTMASLVQGIVEDETNQIPFDIKKTLFYYYGTFSKTMMTMFQILFSNWIPCARILIDNVSEWYAAVFVIYRCFIGFAVMSVVRAVFVQSTLKVAQQDEELLIAQKRKQNEVNKKNLVKLFKEIDTSGDGELSFDELEAVLDNPKMKLWMNALEIDTNDLTRLFHLLDDGDGNISIDEFIGGIGRLKGPAKAIDLAGLIVATTKIEGQIAELMRESQTNAKKRATEK